METKVWGNVIHSKKLIEQEKIKIANKDKRFIMLFFDIEHYKCKWVNALKIVKMGHCTI